MERQERLNFLETPQLPALAVEIPISARSSIAGKAGASGRAAARLRAGSQYARVLAEIRRRPCTDHDIAKATGLPLTTVLARRWALIHRGLVLAEPVGIVDTAQGTQNSLWGVSEAGRSIQV